MDMHIPLRSTHQTRPALRIHAQSRAAATHLAARARTRTVALTISLLRRARQAVAAETLRSVFRARDAVARCEAVVCAAGGTRARAPVRESARVAVRGQVCVAALVFPGFGTLAGFHGDGAGGAA